MTDIIGATIRATPEHRRALFSLQQNITVDDILLTKGTPFYAVTEQLFIRTDETLHPDYTNYHPIIVPHSALIFLDYVPIITPRKKT